MSSHQQEPEDGDRDGTDPGADHDAVEASGGSVQLIEIAPGLAVVFGDGPVPGHELLPLTLLSPSDRSMLEKATAPVLSGGNLGAQALQGWQQSRGLVRLAPETLKALKAAKPLTNGGWNLGTLVSNGKFAHSVRWLPASSAGATAVAASLGPALVLVALQAQIGQVMKAVERVAALGQELLDQAQREQWAAVLGLHQDVMEALEHAMHVGEVTGGIWTDLAGKGSDLREQRLLQRRNLEAHLNNLKRQVSAKDRVEWMRRSGTTVLENVQMLMLAEQAWFAYNAMRVNHLRAHPSSSGDLELAERLATQFPEQHRASLEESARLVEGVIEAFEVLADRSSSAKFSLGGERKAARDVRRLAQRCHEVLQDLSAGQIESIRPVPEPPALSVIEDSVVPDFLLRRVRWHLGRDETLVGLAAVGCRRGSGYAMVTTRRLLLASADGLRESNAVDKEVPLADLRFVRLEEPAKDSWRIRLVTPGEDVDLQLRRWASEEQHREVARAFYKLLASHMNLPAAELVEPPHPLLPQLRSAPDRQPSQAVHGRPDHPQKSAAGEDFSGEAAEQDGVHD